MSQVNGVRRRLWAGAGNRWALLAGALMVAPMVATALPTVWQSRGIGGGGAFFAPSFSPHDPNHVTLTTDMSAMFRSTDLGANWTTVSALEIQANRPSFVRFTSDALIQYSLDYTTNAGVDSVVPSKSTDGGITWTPTNDPTGGEAYFLSADPAGTQRLIVTGYNALYFSSNGGTSFASKYTAATGNGLHVGGAFWDGATIYVGTNDGLLRSTDNGASFSVAPIGGIATGQAIVSMAGAKEGGTTRLFALTADAGDVYAGVTVEDLFYSNQDMYVLDVGGSWTLRNTGMSSNASDGLAIVACALNDIDVAYSGGQRSSLGDFPMIYKTTNGGANWASTLTYVGNVNIVTGWGGQNGDRGWSYDGGPTGLAVAPNDSNKLGFCGYGFFHLSTNGGTNWRQAYVNQADENPANTNTPTGKAYRGVGLEDTASWNLDWFDADNMWASMTDIRGLRSTNAGAAWSFNYTGHTMNTSYNVVVHPTTNVGYMATSSIHDIYQTTYLTDARLNSGDGEIRFSTNKGASWSLLHDFNDPVVDLALDPTNTNRMYASVVDSNNGGIFVSNNINLAGASTWAKVTNPPRTEGHPFVINVLNDGDLVVSYSGRRTTVFTQSSGVFLSENGGTTWADRSGPNMLYYVKDVVIDPHDPAQDTWYACVWSGYGGPFATNNDAGGLYRTTDRGLNWTRIWKTHRVNSITIHPDPARASEAYVTTETEGLWHTTNLGAAPTLTRLTNYPFREPKRVHFNPFNTNEIWVTNFGNGLRIGVEPVTVSSTMRVY